MKKISNKYRQRECFTPMGVVFTGNPYHAYNGTTTKKHDAAIVEIYRKDWHTINTSFVKPIIYLSNLMDCQKGKPGGIDPPAQKHLKIVHVFCESMLRTR